MLEDFDWRRATFRGARREQMRCWASLTVVEMLDAIEAMGELFPDSVAPTRKLDPASTPPQ